ncbi:hypothetical protein LJC08_04675 [Methanimicrococcus sp. OttesenSCG-928-J09]|nr:hypothetical protein [Methanimicrococcus sp. OttesenSCG-928-J09]
MAQLPYRFRFPIAVTVIIAANSRLHARELHNFSQNQLNRGPFFNLFLITFTCPYKTNWHSYLTDSVFLLLLLLPPLPAAARTREPHKFFKKYKKRPTFLNEIEKKEREEKKKDSFLTVLT